MGDLMFYVIIGLAAVGVAGLGIAGAAPFVFDLRDWYRARREARQVWARFRADVAEQRKTIHQDAPRRGRR